MGTSKRIWDNRELIGELMKSSNTKLKVELVARDGVKYVNIREWYMKKSEGVWKPGMSGLAIPIEIPIENKLKWPMSEVIVLINAAFVQAVDFAIEDEANAVYAKE